MIRSFLKSAWGRLTAIVALGYLLLQTGPTVLENAGNLPSQFEARKQQFQSWYYEDAEWTGNWSPHPEGIVELGEMNLSDTDMRVTIWATQGTIEGTIATPAICKAVPLLNYVQLKGEVSGDRADVVAWDYVNGKTLQFGILELVRADDVLTVVLKEGMEGWFPPEARIARHPDTGGEPEPDTTICEEARAEFLKTMPQ